MTSVVFFLFVAGVPQGTENPGVFTQPEAGVWSRAATYLWPGPTAIADAPKNGRSLHVPSPDGTKVLVVRDADLSVHRTGGGQIGQTLPLEDLAEVLWSPDSRAFAITESDGGWVGTWSVHLYRVEKEESLVEVDVAKEPLADFNRRVSARPSTTCSVESGNLGMAGWKHGAARVILVAEAPNHSSDCDMGRIHGYLVDARTGSIEARYDAAEVYRLFGSMLGGRFR